MGDLATTHRIVESAMVSPLIIPRVGDEPRVLASPAASTENHDGVTAQLRAAGVVIHTAGVDREGVGQGDTEQYVHEPAKLEPQSDSVDVRIV